MWGQRGRGLWVPVGWEIVWEGALGLLGSPGCRLQDFVGFLVYHRLNPNISYTADRAQRKLCVCMSVRARISHVCEFSLSWWCVHPTDPCGHDTGKGVLGRGDSQPACDFSLRPHAQALWTKDGAAVVYPCHAVVVVLRIDTREQCFFLGHTDKVGAA